MYNPLSGLPPTGLQPPQQKRQPLTVPSITEGAPHTTASGNQAQKFPSFKYSLPAVEAIPENSHPDAQRAGDPGWVAGRDGAHGTYDEYSPQVAEQAKQIGGMYDVDNPDSIPNLQRKEEAIRQAPVSKTRQVLGAAAGIGMGIATANPLAGLGMRNMITQTPNENRAQSFHASEVAPAEGRAGAAKEIAGLYGKAGELNVAGQGERNKERTNELSAGEVEHVTTGGSEPGSTDTIEVPKHRGAFADRQVGHTKLPNNAERAANYEIKAQADGTLTRVDKLTSKAEPVLGGDGQPVKIAAENKQAFDQFWNALSPEERTADKALEWQKAGAIQAGVNQQNVQDTKDTSSVEEGQAIAAIHKAFDMAASKDPSLLKDPIKAFEVKKKIIDRMAKDPSGKFNKHVPNLLKLPEFKAPPKDVGFH